MNSTDVISRKVDELQKQVEEIEELGVKLLEEAHMDEGTTGTGLSSIDYRSSLRKLQRDAILKYQQ